MKTTLVRELALSIARCKIDSIDRKRKLCLGDVMPFLHIATLAQLVSTKVCNKLRIDVSTLNDIDVKQIKIDRKRLGANVVKAIGKDMSLYSDRGLRNPHSLIYRRLITAAKIKIIASGSIIKIKR